MTEARILILRYVLGLLLLVFWGHWAFFVS